MKRWMVVAAASLLIVAGLGFGVFRWLRGGSGASERYGGSLEAKLISEFPNEGQESWAHGEPVRLSQLRGKPVLIEVWSPG